MSEEQTLPQEQSLPSKKRGPKPKPQVDVEALEVRIDNLELALSHIATLTGYPSVMPKYDIEKYEYTPEDLRGRKV